MNTWQLNEKLTFKRIKTLIFLLKFFRRRREKQAKQNRKTLAVYTGFCPVPSTNGTMDYSEETKVQFPPFQFK